MKIRTLLDKATCSRCGSRAAWVSWDHYVGDLTWGLDNLTCGCGEGGHFVAVFKEHHPDTKKFVQALEAL